LLVRHEESAWYMRVVVASFTMPPMKQREWNHRWFADLFVLPDYNKTTRLLLYRWCDVVASLREMLQK